MSLYRYVDSKDELHAVMLDVAYGPPDLRYAARRDWRARITAWATQIRSGDSPIRGPSELAPVAPPLTPNAIAWMEAGLEALEPALRSAASSGSRPCSPSTAGARTTSASPARWASSVQPDPDRPRAPTSRIIGRARRPGPLPHLAGAGPEALDDDDEDFFEEEFDRGLSLFLDGIEALIARSR